MFLVEVESGKPSGICKKRKRRFILLAPIIIFMIGIIATVYKGIHIKKQNNGLPTY